MASQEETIAILRGALREQLLDHWSTWMAARADVEGVELSNRLFEMEPSVKRARAALEQTGAA